MNWFTGQIGTKVYRTISIIFLLLFSMSVMDSCEKDKEKENLLNNLSALNLENQSFQTEIQKNKEKITSQDQIIITQKQAIDNGLIEIKRLKNIKSKVRIVTKTKIDTLFIPYTKIVKDTILLEKGFKWKNYFDYVEPNGWFALNGYASNLGVGIDSLKIKNDYSIYIADKKLNMFGKSKPEVILLNKNPYTHTIQMNNVVIEVYKPFYKKNGFWASVGFVGGLLLAK